MSQRFRNGSRQFAGAVILATVLAGVACIATSGLANVAKFATTSVDRTHKGDQKWSSKCGFWKKQKQTDR
jgi:hypothetical protein